MFIAIKNEFVASERQDDLSDTDTIADQTFIWHFLVYYTDRAVVPPPPPPPPPSRSLATALIGEEVKVKGQDWLTTIKNVLAIINSKEKYVMSDTEFFNIVDVLKLKHHALGLVYKY